MDERNKIDIKLPNGAAFSADGSEALVRDLFAQWMETAKSTPAAAVAHPVPPPAPPGVTPPLIPPSPSELGGNIQLDRTTLERLFRVDGENVSLMALPRGEGRDSESLVAILYGFAALRNQTSVTADRLMKSGRQSGIQGIRLHRVIGQQGALITESGTGKAKRYGLNNPGMRRAEEILRGILG